MGLSEDLSDQFNKFMEQTQTSAEMNVTFSIMVLGTNIWSLNASPCEFTIPREILPTYERFQQYYQTKFSARKLTWLWNYSKNELRMNYLNQKYILMASSYQMAVLVQYNDSDSLSLDDLVRVTGITKDLLSPVLATLLEFKLLIGEGKERYNLNYAFKFEKVCSTIVLRGLPH